MSGAEDFTDELNRDPRDEYFRGDPGAQSADYKNGHARGNGCAEPGPEFMPRMWRRRDPKTIPPRPWLYGCALIRNEVTGWGSASGTGKTAALITTALASITGRDLLGQYPRRKCRWLILHCEESYDEFERRLAAAKQHYQIPDEAIEGSLFHHSGEGFVIAREDANGTVTRQPIADKLLAFMTANAIDVVAADPFIATYIGKENQNETQSAVTRIWKNEVAKPANAAVLLVTHFRKGQADPGNADMFRGGRAFIDAVRQAFTFTRMTDEEAEQYGVDRDLRRQLIRVDDAKVNMAPKGSESWLKLVSVELGNGTAEYPNGDNVHAVEVWTPPNVFSGVSYAVLNQILDQIDKGPEEGERYSSRKDAGQRWAGNPIIQLANKSEADAARIIQAWKKSKLLIAEKYFSEKQSKDREGLRVDPLKRPGVNHD